MDKKKVKILNDMAFKDLAGRVPEELVPDIFKGQGLIDIIPKEEYGEDLEAMLLVIDAEDINDEELIDIE